jgi:hypothetical protein
MAPAAATAATATAATATAASAAPSFFATALQGGMSVMSAMSAVRAGDAQADSYREQSAASLFDAKNEQINSTNRQAGLRRELVESLGQRDAAYAASGVDLSFGTPAVARDQAIDDANRALEGDSANRDMRVARLKERSAGFDRMAKESARSGRLKALGVLGQTAISAVRRG